MRVLSFHFYSAQVLGPEVHMHRQLRGLLSTYLTGELRLLVSVDGYMASCAFPLLFLFGVLRHPKSELGC